MIQLKAVIFDYGNVLCLPQTMDDMAGMAGVLGIGVDEMHRLYWQSRVPFDRGDLTVDSYWNALAAEAGRSLTASQLAEIVRLDNESWSRPDAVMVRWAARLRTSGIRTGVLSNMPITLRAWLAAHAHWLDDFDHRTFSCDVRLTKPEAAIYEHSLRGLDITAADALFLDDKEANVEGARRRGLHGLLFRSPTQARAALNGVYALPDLDL
jgi:putative hydrolase of the HAD superfamily